MERGMDWEGKGRESGGGRWVGNEWKNMESADSSQFPWQRQAFPTHSFPLVSFSLSLCLIPSLTSFTLQFLFRFFFSFPFFSVSVRLCNHVTASSPPSARWSPPFLFPLTPSSPPPGFPPSFPLSFPLSFPFFPLPQSPPNPFPRSFPCPVSYPSLSSLLSHLPLCWLPEIPPLLSQSVSQSVSLHLCIFSFLLTQLVFSFCSYSCVRLKQRAWTSPGINERLSQGPPRHCPVKQKRCGRTESHLWCTEPAACCFNGAYLPL